MLQTRIRNARCTPRKIRKVISDNIRNTTYMHILSQQVVVVFDDITRVRIKCIYS